MSTKQQGTPAHAIQSQKYISVEPCDHILLQSPCGMKKVATLAQDGTTRFIFLFFQGRLSTQSNVWSFGITFWELLTLCRHRPFALLTDIGKSNISPEKKCNHARLRPTLLYIKAPKKVPILILKLLNFKKHILKSLVQFPI